MTFACRFGTLASLSTVWETVEISSGTLEKSRCEFLEKMTLAMPRSCVHLLGNAWTDRIFYVMKDLLYRRHIWESGNLCKNLNLHSIWHHWRSWGNSWDIREMSYVVFPSSAVLFILYLNNRGKSAEKLITENFSPSKQEGPSSSL